MQKTQNTGFIIYCLFLAPSVALGITICVPLSGSNLSRALQSSVFILLSQVAHRLLYFLLTKSLCITQLSNSSVLDPTSNPLSIVSSLSYAFLSALVGQTEPKILGLVASVFVVTERIIKTG